MLEVPFLDEIVMEKTREVAQRTARETARETSSRSSKLDLAMFRETSLTKSSRSTTRNN